MNDFVDQFGRTIHQTQVTDDSGAVFVVATASDGSLEARFPLASYSQAFALSTFNAMGPQVQSLQIERSSPLPVLFAKADGTPAPTVVDGRIRVAAEKSVGSRINFYSHDWTDPTTWYSNAAYVSAEAATQDLANDVSGKTWAVVSKPLVDTCHGKITQEDILRDASGRSYRVVVTVDGAAQVEQDPHLGTGGDYTVDYQGGKVIFASAPSGTANVRASYHWVNLAPKDGSASKFIIAPTAGKKLTVDLAECQFSTDVNLTDTILFEAWGIADFFMTAAQMTALGITAGVGYKINLLKFVYKSFSDFQNDAFKAFPVYPAMGDPANWRSQKQPVCVFDWDYIRSTAVQSSKGMELRMYLQHDKPLDGWMATTTFYGVSEDDV